MAEQEKQIIVGSGVSWLLEKLQQKALDRLEHLKEGIADGVPRDEYEAMCGRYAEAKRWHKFMISEVFEEFQQAEDNSLEDDDLEEMSDD